MSFTQKYKKKTIKISFFSNTSNIKENYKRGAKLLYLKHFKILITSTITLTCVLSINDDISTEALLEKIGYIYNQERQKLARKMLKYLKLKKETIKKRKEIAKKSLKLFKQGYTPSQVIKKFKIEKEHQRLVKELYRKFRKNEKIDIDKIRINRTKFPKYKDF